MRHVKTIKLLALDVDGVLTDGVIYYGPSGDALKGFSARDGMEITLARMAGLKTAVITGRRSPMVEQRAKDLHIDYVVQEVQNKLTALQQICADLGISLSDVCYMGDDLNDLPLIQSVGFSAAPLDACEEVRQEAAFVSAFRGGHGALRELVEYILKNQNVWETILQHFQSGQAEYKQ